jgi:hypothetical protein
MMAAYSFMYVLEYELLKEQDISIVFCVFENNTRMYFTVCIVALKDLQVHGDLAEHLRIRRLKSS